MGKRTVENDDAFVGRRLRELYEQHVRSQQYFSSVLGESHKPKSRYSSFVSKLRDGDEQTEAMLLSVIDLYQKNKLQPDRRRLPSWLTGRQTQSGIANSSARVQSLRQRFQDASYLYAQEEQDSDSNDYIPISEVNIRSPIVIDPPTSAHIFPAGFEPTRRRNAVVASTSGINSEQVSQYQDFFETGDVDDMDEYHMAMDGGAQYINGLVDGTENGHNCPDDVDDMAYVIESDGPQFVSSSSAQIHAIR
ncbi:hypothetical protein MP228_013000 [Amoeboaphelidium protococcarum]|nr:hypothetical protein MP228_013000 [Amoeboaphelidium protococcarum]